MKNYYIFRHGETIATKQKKWYWHRLYSATILEEGKPALLKLAEYLNNIPSDYNACSPFLRCRQTAEIITQVTGKQFELDRRLREYAFEFPQFFKRRVLNFLNEMEKSNKKTIIICSHSIVIEVMIHYLSRDNPTLAERFKAPLPGVLTVIKDGNLEQIDFNK